MSDIVQIDGNVSLDTSISSETSSMSISSPGEIFSIPVLITNRGPKPPPENRKPLDNITVKRSNKLLAAVQLPVVVNPIQPRGGWIPPPQMVTFNYA